ncbi:MAG: ABC transporter permease, partial [Nocardioides sp.]
QASFIVIFPLTFIADTFAPIEGFPAPLKLFAVWNPVSAVAQAARDLFGNERPLTQGPAATSWALDHPVGYTLIWSLVIMAVFIPLAGAQYRKATSR